MLNRSWTLCNQLWVCIHVCKLPIPVEPTRRVFDCQWFHRVRFVHADFIQELQAWLVATRRGGGEPPVVLLEVVVDEEVDDEVVELLDVLEDEVVDVELVVLEVPVVVPVVEEDVVDVELELEVEDVPVVDEEVVLVVVGGALPREFWRIT